MTDIVVLCVLTDGRAAIAARPPIACSTCSRLAALGTFTVNRATMRNEFRCVDCAPAPEREQP